MKLLWGIICLPFNIAIIVIMLPFGILTSLLGAKAVIDEQEYQKNERMRAMAIKYGQDPDINYPRK
jgi:hypothetical protein